MYAFKVLIVAILLICLPLVVLAHSEAVAGHFDTNKAVQDLVVKIQSISGEVSDYVNEVSTIKKLKSRNELLTDLAVVNPAAFFGAIFTDKEREKIPKLFTDKIEVNVTQTGKIRAFQVDDFSRPENSQTDYYLEVDGKEFSLYSVVPLSQFDPGSTVTVSGIGLDNILVAKNVTAADTSVNTESIGEQKTAVLLVDFEDSVAQRPFNIKEAQDIIFDSQFQKFYQEQSYGKISFVGDVFGWFTIPRSINRLNSACGAVTISEIENIIVQNSINLEKYDRLVIMPSHPSITGGCSSVGKYNQVFNGKNYYISVSWIGNIIQYNEPSQWGSQPFLWTNLDYLLAHELGHAIGLPHANGLDCHNEIIYGNNCQDIEYGNAFDTMGNISYGLHFNAVYKDKLGWLSKENLKTISASTKEIKLSPLETGKENAAIKIILGDKNTRIKNSVYYLEYRNPIGFDANLGRKDLFQNTRGVFVNKNPLFSTESKLLDMTPSDSTSWYAGIKNTTLNPGKVFIDPGMGISIKVLGSSNLSVSRESSPSVAVIYSEPECQNFAPKINNAFALLHTSAGATGYVSLQYENADYFGCGATDFVTEISLPEGWSIAQMYPDSGSQRLVPEQPAYSDVYFYIPFNTTPGAYFIETRVRNTSSGLVSSYPTNIFVSN